MSQNSTPSIPLSWYGFLPEHAIFMSRAAAPSATCPVAPPSFWISQGDSQSRLILIDSEAQASTQAASELLGKMIQALGKQLTEIHWTYLAPNAPQSVEPPSLSEPLQGKVILLLGENASFFEGHYQSLGAHVVKSISPSTLLDQPAKKRLAWEHLQKAAQLLNWSIPKRS